MLPDLFKDILIPVDFSINTEVAIKHAVELASANGSIIHLLHVVKPKTIWEMMLKGGQSNYSSGKGDDTDEIQKKLAQWQQTIQETIPLSLVKFYMVSGSVQENILDIAKKINPQLIIIGKKSNSKLFSFFSSVYPNELAKLSDCPVLTVMKGSINSKIKIILVPIRSFVPKRKIELIVAFAKVARARVHLIGFQSDIESNNTEKAILLDTFRILKLVLNSPIEYQLLKGNNFAKTTLKYAKEIGADMILVNPWAETQISKLTGKHVHEVLMASSKLKILSVEPYHSLDNLHI